MRPLQQGSDLCWGAQWGGGFVAARLAAAPIVDLGQELVPDADDVEPVRRDGTDAIEGAVVGAGHEDEVEDVRQLGFHGLVTRSLAQAGVGVSPGGGGSGVAAV